MRAVWHWGSGLCSVLLAQTAHAADAAANTTWQEPPETPETPAAPVNSALPREHWYGWQILISDVSSLLVAGATSQSWLAAAGYIVAPPLIHVVHGQGIRALTSVGVRVGFPLAGAAVAIEGADTCSSSDVGFCRIGWGVLGVVIGLTGAGLDTAFAYEPAYTLEQTGLRFAPQLIITDREARWGVAGSF